MRWCGGKLPEYHIQRITIIWVDVSHFLMIGLREVIGSSKGRVGQHYLPPEAEYAAPSQYVI